MRLVQSIATTWSLPIEIADPDPATVVGVAEGLSPDGVASPPGDDAGVLVAAGELAPGLAGVRSGSSEPLLEQARPTTASSVARLNKIFTVPKG